MDKHSELLTLYLPLLVCVWGIIYPPKTEQYLVGWTCKHKHYSSFYSYSLQSSSLHATHKNMLRLLEATLHLRPDPSTLEPEDGGQTHVCKYQLCLLGGFQQMHLSLLKSQLLWMGESSINEHRQVTEIYRLVSQIAG